MNLTSQNLTAMVDTEIKVLRDDRIVQCLRQYLIPPQPITLGWDYGAPGETHDGWLVLKDVEQQTGIAYCHHGFGPKNPWGLIGIDTVTAVPCMGMDSGWFSSLLCAFFDSYTATRLDIWQIYRGDRAIHSFTSISGDLSWDEAWTRTELLRRSNPESRYDVDTPEYRRLRSSPSDNGN